VLDTRIFSRDCAVDTSVLDSTYIWSLATSGFGAAELKAVTTDAPAARHWGANVWSTRLQQKGPCMLFVHPCTRRDGTALYTRPEKLGGISGMGENFPFGLN